MADILLDTNIISYAIKNDTRRLLYEPHVINKRTCLSFVSMAELYRWAISRNWGKPRISAFKVELARHLVLPYDDALAWGWARMMCMKGRSMEAGDAWIAATALRHGLPLVTHNRKHFEGIPGLTVISEA